jgi:type IV pilus assembly protein PilC
MVTYKYSALSPDGAKVNGVVDAIDEYAAVEKIKVNCPVVLKIEPVKKGGLWEILNGDVGSKKVDAKALSVMCSQFSIILSSGIGIDQALTLIAGQTEDKQLKKMLELSAEDVSSGTPLATAFEKNNPQLPVLFIETIRAGEMSGTLTQSFATLEEYYKKTDAVSKKIKSAMSYPMFVLGVAVVVIIIIMVRVMPTFTSMFDDFGGELPTMTKVLISITDWFQRWWLLLAGILIALVVGIILYKHGERGRLNWAKLQLKMPTMGKIAKLQASQQFANTMASLLQAGLPVANALDVTSKCLDNYAIGQEVKGYVEKIQTGHSLGETIDKSEYFPEVLKQMTGVGEKTGELGHTLHTIGEYYTSEADYATQKMIAKLEPTLLIVMAIIAGFVVIAIYLPMFTMYNYM